MRAIRVHEFGPPEVMRLEDVAEPKPGPGQVLVDIKAVGVNPVDTYIRSGAYGIKSLPYTPGSDAGGVIEAVGEGVLGGLRPGDRVYTSGAVTGAYAQKALCGEDQVHRLPGKVTFQQGASIGVPFATAYRALFQKAKAAPGEAVLIHGGSGGVGTAAIQLAHSYGMEVIATGGTDEGRKLVLAQGANYAIDHHSPNKLEEILRLTGGRGVDVILEMLSNVNLGADLKALARGGRVVVIGSRGPVEIDPRDSMGRDASILGMSLFNATEKEIKGIHAALEAGLEMGFLCPVVGRDMPLADAPTAHHEILEKTAYGKIILMP